MPINYKNYPENWKDEIRPAIIKRDGNRCKHCGVKNRVVGYRDSSNNFIECDSFMVEWTKRQGIKVVKIALAIAHLDQDRTNNDPSNLAALCQKCHLNHDHPTKMKARMMQQHYSSKSPYSSGASKNYSGARNFEC